MVIVGDCGLSPQDARGGLTVTAGMCQPKAYTEEIGYEQLLLLVTVV